MTGRLDGLPPQVVTVLSEFVAETQAACGSALVSIVLFGSAADGQLSPTSDVNVLVVLRTFAPDRIDLIRNTFISAEAAIKLRVMFLLEHEINAATELFAQKFADILRRHRTIHGAEVFAAIQVPREAKIFRLRQILLNLTIRLRGAYVSRGQQPDQVLRLLADAFGPLRASCATLLELENTPHSGAGAAMDTIATALGAPAIAAVVGLNAAHAGQPTAQPNVTAPLDTLIQVIEFIMRLSERAQRLS